MGDFRIQYPGLGTAAPLGVSMLGMQQIGAPPAMAPGPAAQPQAPGPANPVQGFGIANDLAARQAAINYYNPYAAGQESVLSEDPEQERIKQLYNEVIDSHRENQKRERGSRVAGEIFSRFVAPGMMVLGGNGTVQGAAQLFQFASGEVDRAKKQTAANDLATVQSLKSLADFVSQTSSRSQKRLAAESRAARDQALFDQRNVAKRADVELREQGNLIKREDVEGRRQQQSNNLNALNAFRAAGLNLNERKIDLYAKISKAKMVLAAEIAKLQAQLQARGQDLFHNDRVSALRAQMQQFEARENRLAQDFNLDVAKARSEMSQGLKKYAGIENIPDIQPINFVAEGIVPAQESDPDLAAGLLAAQGYDSEFGGLPRQTAGQQFQSMVGGAPTAPGQIDPAAIAKFLSRIAGKDKAGIEEEAKLFEKRLKANPLTLLGLPNAAK